MAVARPDGAGIRLLDVSTQGVPGVDLAMKGHDVASIAASADGRILATLDRPSGWSEGDEARIALWDLKHPETPKALLTLPPPRSETNASPFRRSRPLLAVSPDGEFVAATWLGEGEVALWDGDGNALEPIDVQANASALALGPAGQLAVAGGGEIVIWDLAQHKPLPGLGRRQGIVHQLRFSPSDGSLLAAATMPGGVELWDVASRALVSALPTRDWVDDLAFSPDGQVLAASQSESIALWSIVEPVGQVQLPESAEVAWSLAFGPDDRLAIASRDSGRATGPLRLWAHPGSSPADVTGWDRVRPSAVGFDSEGSLVALEARGLRWYRPPDPTPLAEADDFRWNPRTGGRGDAPPPGGPPGRFSDRALARSRDGRAFALIRGGDILAWDADHPDDLDRLSITDDPDFPGLGRGPTTSLVALSPNGSRVYLYAAGGDRLACLTRDGRKTLRPHWSSFVREGVSLALSHDGATLALGDRSGGFTLVDAATGVPLDRVEPLAEDPPAQAHSILVFSARRSDPGRRDPGPGPPLVNPGPARPPGPPPRASGSHPRPGLRPDRRSAGGLGREDRQGLGSRQAPRRPGTPRARLVGV